MHNKYAKDGVATVSVSLDDLSDQNAPKVKDKVLKFLQSKGADFPNYILDELPPVWQDHLHIEGPPAVLVLNRQGEQAKIFSAEFTYEDVEKQVTELLPRK
ncbi:MAG: hypothetical protein JO112_08340 [Planctomycetes bacterium]|nr:hypothetical protein [Planctomycetota bacterium]